MEESWKKLCFLNPICDVEELQDGEQLAETHHKANGVERVCQGICSQIRVGSDSPFLTGFSYCFTSYTFRSSTSPLPNVKTLATVLDSIQVCPQNWNRLYENM